MMPSFLSEVEWLLHFLMVYVCNSCYHFPYLHYYSTHSTPIIIEINLSLLLLPSFLCSTTYYCWYWCCCCVVVCCGGGGGDIIRLAPRLGFTYTHSHTKCTSERRPSPTQLGLPFIPLFQLAVNVTPGFTTNDMASIAENSQPWQANSEKNCKGERWCKPEGYQPGFTFGIVYARKGKILRTVMLLNWLLWKRTT